MKKLIYIAAAFFFLSGCVTEKKCNRKYPPQVHESDSVVFKEKLVPVFIHDTVFIAADTVFKKVPVFINKGVIYSKPVFAYTEYAHARAQVVNSNLNLNLFQNDTAIARLLKNNVTIKEKEVYKTKKVTVKVWEVHWYDKAARWLAGIFIIYLLIVTAIKIIKIYFKPF